MWLALIYDRVSVTLNQYVFKLLKVWKVDMTQIYCTDPTVTLHQTQQLSLIKFDFRYFLSTGAKISIFENLSFLRSGKCYADASIYSNEPKLINMIKMKNLISNYSYSYWITVLIGFIIHVVTMKCFLWLAMKVAIIEDKILWKYSIFSAMPHETSKKLFYIKT